MNRLGNSLVDCHSLTMWDCADFRYRTKFCSVVVLDAKRDRLTGEWSRKVRFMGTRYSVVSSTACGRSSSICVETSGRELCPQS
jgi:hypothetical protein